MFDAIDEGPTGEVDGIGAKDHAHVAEACTLCDMCFLTKCPYVPPHPFDIDIPHLILRYRAAKRRAGEQEFVREQLGQTDRNGKLAKPVAGLANWATARKNTPLRKLLEAHRRDRRRGRAAEVPLARPPSDRLKAPLAPNPDGPAFGQRKVALYATCFVDYNTARHGRGGGQGAGAAGRRGEAGLSRMLRHAAARGRRPGGRGRPRPSGWPRPSRPTSTTATTWWR